MYCIDCSTFIKHFGFIYCALSWAFLGWFFSPRIKDKGRARERLIMVAIATLLLVIVGNIIAKYLGASSFTEILILGVTVFVGGLIAVILELRC